MPYETIIYEKTDQIAVITLNRPEKLNALSPTLLKELHAALSA
ncbi:MAG: enoyl-CoA hydratase, partial [Candidatus Lindowbacteria bacterium]|nr:enoyl-CoA hydratase [Candidatus Lindowbacteria bacterium]